MKTLLVNASPKGDSDKSNSFIICNEFNKDMKSPCEIRHIAKSDLGELAEYIKDFDSIIFVMPLYIHAMPGIMMEFIEHMSPQSQKDKYMGFIVQAGFIESAQGDYIKAYLESLTSTLNYKYLGTIYKGEAAGIYMFPKGFKNVLKKFNDLGRLYELNHSFDREIVESLGNPHKIDNKLLKKMNFITRIGIGDMGWNWMIRKNKAYKQRLDKPFL